MSAPALALYRAAARAAGPPARAWLSLRAARGKEDRARLQERLGRASAPRPGGPLVWLHAASVGESLSVLPLIAALRRDRPDLALLLTTGTLASARLMAERLPQGAIHQFAPIDAGAAPARFLAHWRPDLAVWVESEIWPAAIARAHESGARLALVNARLSARSARRWGWAPGTIRDLLRRFSAIAAQDEASATRLIALGADPATLRATGSLKAGAAPPDRREAREELAAAIAGRPVWLAASTHPGEEAAAARAHRIARDVHPRLLTLIAPRHPERGAAIAADLAAAGLSVTRRAAGEAPRPDTDIHILDTLGEMGAWLRLAPVCFLGASLAPRGGHNPHEPAALGSAIVHGPDTANFAADFSALAAAGGARRAADADALGAAVADLLSDEAARAAMTAVARRALGDGAAALAAVREMLAPLLPAAR